MNIKEKQLLARVIEEVDLFHTDFQWMTLQTVMGFMLIAMHDGLRIDQLMDMMDIKQSHASRLVKRLGPGKGYLADDGYNLVYTEPDPEDTRRKTLWLTPQGHTFKYKLLDHLGGIDARYSQRKAPEAA